MFENLWFEKYRPKNLDDMVLSEANRNAFVAYGKQGEIQHCLFAGPPGIGKTSLAKIISKDILKCQYLYINASDENGIDTIRTKVVNFAQTRSLDGKIKIIILDEVDGLTPDAQRALRNTMEEYGKTTRFVLTANYLHRVIDALKSRCSKYDLRPSVEQYLFHLKFIVFRESITIEDNALQKIAKQHYPDFRVAINELQKLKDGGLQSIDNTSSKEVTTKIIKLILAKEPIELRKFIIENESKFYNDYPQLLKDMFNVVAEADFKNKDVQRQWLICIAEHLYRSSFVLDQEINCSACFLQLQSY